MNKRCLVSFVFLFSANIYAADGNKMDYLNLSWNAVDIDEDLVPVDSITDRAKNSTADEGFYWDNGFKGRWAPFGALYNTRIYYRKALNREANNFWYADSALEFGIEQEVSVFSKTSFFVLYQPMVAFSIQAKIGYSKDFLQSALLTGPDDDYSHAFPSISGLNPGGRDPDRVDLNTLELELIPTWTVGGKVGDGMLALIYSPHITYFYNSGIDKEQYIYQNSNSIVLKGQDILWRHDIKLGYAPSYVGTSFALTGIVEHVQSISGIFRAGVFTSFSYEKSLAKQPNLVPFFKGQIGTWVKDRYMKGDIAIQIDTGIKWKFK